MNLIDDLREEAAEQESGNVGDGAWAAELLRLAAVELDKLPVLADGTLVTDPYSFVWHPMLGKCLPISDGRARPWANEHYHNIRPISECYDTEDAAQPQQKGE